MNLLVSKKSWLLAPVVYLLSLAALAFVWSVMEPTALRTAFDADGRSFFETLTLPFYALIVPAVWLCCPFSGSAKRKAFLCAAVSCVAVMAVVKQLDIHLAFSRKQWELLISKTRAFKYSIFSGCVVFFILAPSDSNILYDTIILLFPRLCNRVR